jgi:hypothetical protein
MPSWDGVESLIRALDGKSRTDVFLDDGGVRCMLAVSGGNEGRYVVAVQEPKAWYYLVDSKKGKEDLMVMISGLADYHPADEITDLATALAAAKYYRETGERSPALEWRRGGPNPKGHGS